jgi:hypothetical protein
MDSCQSSNLAQGCCWPEKEVSFLYEAKSGSNASPAMNTSSRALHAETEARLAPKDWVTHEIASVRKHVTSIKANKNK